MKEKKEKKTLSTRGLAPSLCFGLHVMEQIMSLPVLPLRSRCNHFEIWNESLRVIYLKQMFRLLKSTVLHRPLLYKSTLLLHATESPGIVAWAAGARTRSCKRLHVHRMKTEGKDGESKKKKETAREFSADIWVRLTERTAPEAGPSPSAPKMTHDCFDFCHPLSPSAPEPKPATNTEASMDTHTHSHTQRHTVTHCILLRLHYLYPQDMSPPCWMTFGLVQH